MNIGICTKDKMYIIYNTPCCHSHFAFKSNDVIKKDNRKYVKCLNCDELIDLTNEL